MRASAVLGFLLALALCALAVWQFDALGAGWWDPIQHGRNEDWDWQLTFYEVSRKTLQEYGQLPFWNPYTQGGVPLWANPEAPFLYPPFLLILGMGTHAGLKAWIALHLFALVGACWLAGREMGLSPIAAHGASLLTLCSAFVPGFILAGHVMYLPLCWLPLSWWALRRGSWKASGLCLSMTLLCGGHYLLVYGALWLVLDWLLESLKPERRGLLAAFFLINGLALGQHWALWGMLPLGIWVLAQQRLQLSRERSLLLLAAGLLTGLLLGVKLTPAPTLFAVAERLEAQRALSIADSYDPLLAWQVLTGLTERLSGHEGQNVFWSPAPVVLGLLGLALAARRHSWALAGLIWWNLGWGGSTPVNLLELLHRLPGLDHLRVVERYSLVWTLYLGWGAGWLLDRCWRWRPPASLLLSAWVLHYVWTAAPLAAQGQRSGTGRSLQLPSGEFVQVEDDLSNFEAVQLNRGKPGCWTTAWLERPAPGLRHRGESDYRGEIWSEPAEALELLEWTPNRLSFSLSQPARVTLNQNGLPGWTAGEVRGESDELGLLTLELSAGRHQLAYWPPGLGLGLLLSVGGLLLLCSPGRWTPRGSPATGSSAPPGAAAEGPP